MPIDKFKLQPVLSYKERLEEALQMELGQIDKAYLREHGLLDSMIAEKQAHMESLQVQWANTQADPHMLELALQFMRNFGRNIEAQAMLVEGLKSQLHRKRAELIEVSNAKRTLEKLKERHSARAHKEEAKMETKHLDELAALKHQRKDLLAY